MNIIILTANENLYLPSFFISLFRNCSDIKAVFITPAGHGKDNSSWNMARKYRSAFGILNLLRLVSRLLIAKFADSLGIGNKKKVYSVQSAAKAYGIPCQLINDVNGEAFHDRLREIKTDLIVSVSCPQIFKKPLIDLAPLGVLNIHGAPLPKYRGLLPSFWMMAKGETNAAVTVFFVNERIDAGDVVVMDHFEIGPEKTLHEFIIRSKQLHGEALLKAISKIKSGALVTYPLEVENGSYFSFPTREAYLEFKSRGCRLW